MLKLRWILIRLLAGKLGVIMYDPGVLVSFQARGDRVLSKASGEWL